jgi:Shikimate 5-dehydrogenase
MKIYGLIGYPLGHSFSAGYFAGKFEKEKIKDCIYKNFSIDDISKLPGIITDNPDLNGLNVTIPYKEQVIKYLDEIDPEAREVGAINTLKILRTGNAHKLKGYNSDVYGFQKSLQPLLKEYHKRALILGTGGASKAIKFVLRKLGIEYISASIEELKENEIRYEVIDKKMIEERLLIIHATPLGTFPNVDSCSPIPYEFLTPKHVLFDLVYNPEETLFLKKGKEKGAKTINGLMMLHMQAERSWEIWNSNI